MSKIGIGGKLRYEIIDNKTGVCVKESDWQNNLVLDSFFANGYCNPFYVHPGNSLRSYLCLGTGAATPPSPTDSDLTNQVRAVVKDYSFAATFLSSEEEHYFTGTSAQRFIFSSPSNPTVYTEGGIRTASESGTLVTRFLFEDPPEIGTDQQLWITYALQVKLPKAPLFSGEIVLPDTSVVPYYYGMVSGTPGTPIEMILGLGSDSIWADGFPQPVFGTKYLGSNAARGVTVYNGSSTTRIGIRMVQAVAGRYSITLPASTANRPLGRSTLFDGKSLLFAPDAPSNSRPALAAYLADASDRTKVIPANYSLTYTFEVEYGRM